MSFGNTQLVPCQSAKNLGGVLDSSLNFRSHIDSIVKSCNFHIRNLYMIKDFVNRKNFVILVHSLIISVSEALFCLCRGTNIYNSFGGVPEFQDTYHCFYTF